MTTDNTAPASTNSTASTAATDNVTPEQHWVFIQRQYGPDLMVGPYASREIADAAFQDSLLIDGFCEEDCLDAFITTDQPTATVEQFIIDPEDPHHFGRSGLGALTMQQSAPELAREGHTGAGPV